MRSQDSNQGHYGATHVSPPGICCTIWKYTTSNGHLGFITTSGGRGEGLCWYDTVHLPLSSNSVRAHSRSTRSSLAVLHPSTLLALCCLTSVLLQALLFPTQHGLYPFLHNLFNHHNCLKNE